MYKKRKLTEYPTQMWNRQLEGASAWRGSHFQNHLVTGYFLVSSKPFKLILRGAVTWADTSSGKQRSCCISPTEDTDTLQTCWNFSSRGKRHMWRGGFREICIYLVENTIQNVKYWVFRHPSDSPTYEFQGIWCIPAKVKLSGTLWKYKETSSLGYIMKFFVAISLNQSERLFFLLHRQSGKIFDIPGW